MAGRGRLELRNDVAKYPFERAQISGIQPKFWPRRPWGFRVGISQRGDRCADTRKGRRGRCELLAARFFSVAPASQFMRTELTCPPSPDQSSALITRMSPDEAGALWADLCQRGWHRVSEEEITDIRCRMKIALNCLQRSTLIDARNPCGESAAQWGRFPSRGIGGSNLHRDCGHIADMHF